MARQVVVIGLGRFGSAVATTLHELGYEVLAIDTDGQLVQELLPNVTHAVQASGADREAMTEIGVRDFDAAVVAISSNIEVSILTTLNLKELGMPYVISKASNDRHARILSLIGANRVIFPERETGTRLAHGFASRAVLDYMNIGVGYGISRIRPPDSFVGRSLGDLGLRDNYNLTLIAIVRREEVIMHPHGRQTIEPNDELIVAGGDEDLAKL